MLLGDHCRKAPGEEGYVQLGCDLRIKLEAIDPSFTTLLLKTGKRSSAGMLGVKITITKDIWDK